MKNSFYLFIVTIVLLSCSSQEDKEKGATGPKNEVGDITNPIVAGKLIYTNTCVNCHGSDGKLMNLGAKDLSLTTLSAEVQKQIIHDGKGSMQGYKDMYSDAEIDAVVQYIATLKQ